MKYLEENILKVRENIENAAKRSNRDSEDITLVGVSKTIDINIMDKAIDLGVSNLGENRVQEMIPKIDALSNRAKFHMIGHLQSNKAKDVVGRVELIHSLDRMSLAKEINKRAEAKNLIVDTLLQVNISEEETKFGLKVEDVLTFIEKLENYKNINIMGLMTIAPHTDNEKILRDVFSNLRELGEKINRQNYPNYENKYLSMGMTNDYEIAIEEGANIIRVGRAIFGDRNY